MSKAPRAIQTPGAAAPAPAPAAAPVDDLAEFQSDELPASEAPSAAELQLALGQALAMNRKLMHRLDIMEGKVKPEEVELPTVAQAHDEAQSMVDKGRRPRAILTREGWYCHPEMARVAVAGAKPI